MEKVNEESKRECFNAPKLGYAGPPAEELFAQFVEKQFRVREDLEGFRGAFREKERHFLKVLFPFKRWVIRNTFSSKRH